MSKGMSKIVRTGRSANIHIPAHIVRDEHSPLPPSADSVEISITRHGLLIKPIKKGKKSRQGAR